MPFELTCYQAGSIANKIGQGFEPTVNHWTITASRLDNGHWVAGLPFRPFLRAEFLTEEEAVRSARDLLLSLNWFVDEEEAREQAERIADRRAEPLCAMLRALLEKHDTLQRMLGMPRGEQSKRLLHRWMSGHEVPDDSMIAKIREVADQ
ncbi:MAG: hypothetical protein ACYTG0_17770 [Planctomycetota bacterium]|jgi:hypothetical protein